MHFCFSPITSPLSIRFLIFIKFITDLRLVLYNGETQRDRERAVIFFMHCLIKNFIKKIKSPKW